MISVMATGSVAWQLRWGYKCIKRDQECRCLALLWLEIFEVYSERKSGSRLAIEVGMVPSMGVRFGVLEDD